MSGPSSLRLFALLPLSLAACMTELDAPDTLCDEGKCDDLVGRTVVVHPRPAPRQVVRDSVYVVRPEIKESGNTIEIWTDDFRIDLSSPGRFGVRGVLTEDTTLPQGLFNSYGFIVEYADAREPAPSWKPLPPIPGDPAWFWSNVIITVNPAEGVTFFGEAVKRIDTNGGVTSSIELRSIEDSRIPNLSSAQFRVFAVPIWDFWDWDETGYETTVAFFR